MEALLGSDIEMLPKNISKMGPWDMQNYDRLMHQLGTKKEPTVEGNTQMHPDSLAMEFAMIKPASSVGEFMRMYDEALDTAEDYLECELEGHDWVDITDLGNFTPDNAPFLWANARQFGCSPDYVVTGAGKEMLRAHVPMAVKHSPVKELGTHLHIQLPDNPRYPLGYYVVSLHERLAPFYSWTHPTARPWYRSPKVYRPKPYGFEYRSLGGSVVNDRSQFEIIVNICFSFMDDVFTGRI